MSNAQVNDGRSIDLIRKLLERNLVDRAVLLGEGRWPGSGPFIQLAAEWQHLSPDERATRLREIGPDGLERARALSDVHPEIGRVLDTLEAQGILTHDGRAFAVEAADVEQRSDAQPVPPAAELEEQAAEPVPDDASAGEGSNAPADVIAAPLPVVVEPAAIDGLPETLATQAATADRVSLRPEVDEEAVAAAEAILERVHERVQATIEHTDATPMPVPEPELVALPPEPNQRDELPEIGVTNGVARERVLSIRRATAAQRVDYTELDTGELSRRELFGALERTERGVETVVGALPQALSRAGVVVVIGHVLPKMVKRLQDGYCDIPGTRSTVRVHPESRIVLVSGSRT
ncbi:MAG: hypothetical protein M9890_07515 [Thermomicrobiales bacterium]|nr:hypothetical protein [Thermomicrobiales bacterium]